MKKALDWLAQCIFFVLLFYVTAAHAEPISSAGLIWINANEAMKTCDRMFSSSIKKAGEIVLDILIDESGLVKNATPNQKKSSIRNEKLTSCVINSFNGHTLQMDATGKEKTISATFQFPRKFDQ